MFAICGQWNSFFKYFHEQWDFSGVSKNSSVTQKNLAAVPQRRPKTEKVRSSFLSFVMFLATQACVEK